MGELRAEESDPAVQEMLRLNEGQPLGELRVPHRAERHPGGCHRSLNEGQPLGELRV